MEPEKKIIEKTTKKIVRLMATDVKGDLAVFRALRKVKGVSFMFSNAVCTATGIDSRKKIGDLDETEIKMLERFIASPSLPPWLLNRRRDLETGRDMHVTMADLDLKKREDISLMKRMHTYKGIRHEMGQPVRGQRTRTSFRTQKTVGVARKKIQQAAKAAPKEEKK